MILDPGVSLLYGAGGFDLRRMLGDRLPGPPFVPPYGVLFPAGRGVPVVLVHGFHFDPEAADGDNPHERLFPFWRGLLARPTVAFGWYSCPGGLKLPRTLWRAWRAHKVHHYHHAWALAAEAGAVLARILAAAPGPVDLLCHSLGSRVALAALIADPALPLRRLLILNGAAHVPQALTAAGGAPHVRVLNVVVPEDDVLDKLGARGSPGLGYRACIGRVGLGAAAPRNWIDIEPDAPAIQAWGRARGWDLAGDDPRAIGDHWHTYRHRGNWPLWRAFLAGDPLEGLPA